MAFVDNRDFARVAVVFLTSDSHNGRVCALTGPGGKHAASRLSLIGTSPRARNKK